MIFNKRILSKSSFGLLFFISMNQLLNPLKNGESIIYSYKRIEFKMIAVEGGTFMMGSNASENKADQRPAHKVTLTDYLIGQTEVSQDLWTAVMGTNPSEFSGKNFPVDNVTWEECQIFVEKLNKIFHDSGQLPKNASFHLPSEAQWEYAAKGGNISKGYKYAGSNDINEVAWTRNNSGSRTHSIMSKSPNELGLYDMSGNVWEWVQDYYDSYRPEAFLNPTGPTRNTGKVIKRGGSWYYAPEYYFQNTFRYGYYTSISDSSIGIRLCLSLNK